MDMDLCVHMCMYVNVWFENKKKLFAMFGEYIPPWNQEVV